MWVFCTYVILLFTLSLSSPTSPLPLSLHTTPQNRSINQNCVSITDCRRGLICALGNPTGTCQQPHSIIGLSHFVSNLIQLDYTTQQPQNSPTPQQHGPTATSRAMAIIYLATHDTFSLCTSAFPPKIGPRLNTTLQPVATRLRRSLRFQHTMTIPSAGSLTTFMQEQCELASIAAGYTAAALLYPRFKGVADSVRRRATANAANGVLAFGRTVASAWHRFRRNDGSHRNQVDDIFISGRLRHQPDPNFNAVTNKSFPQPNFGRFWGAVHPFIVDDIKTDLFIPQYPDINSAQYRADFSEVKTFGRCSNRTVSLDGRDVLVNDLGTFWGYDGMPGIGVPPRLYLQVVLSVDELHDLPFANQLRVLTAVNAAMADAGIAAWFWKFVYDLWRPVVGIQRDPIEPEEGWSPFGISFSNIRPDLVPTCLGLNPGFPSYPSGHSSFGTAAFQTVARVLGMNPRDIRLSFTSDEFNGVTVDGVTNRRRQVLTQNFTLFDCIEQNQESRVFNGVHWRFDSDGGDLIGRQIAARAADEFPLIS